MKRDAKQKIAVKTEVVSSTSSFAADGSSSFSSITADDNLIPTLEATPTRAHTRQRIKVRQRVTRAHLDAPDSPASSGSVHERLDAVERRLDTIEQRDPNEQLSAVLGRLEALERDVKGAQAGYSAAPMQTEPSQEPSSEKPSQEEPSQEDTFWEVELDSEHYKLEASVWEAPVVLGLVLDEGGGAGGTRKRSLRHSSSLGASIFTWLLVALNVAVQATLMYIFNWPGELN
jgi:hypothetical protein